jgi:hypothetical protein
MSGTRNTAFTGALTLPAKLERIGSEAFSGMQNMTTVTMPNTILFIDKKAFSLCSSLQSFTLTGGNGVNLATDDSGKLLIYKNAVIAAALAATGTIIVPEGVTSIAESAFAGHITGTAGPSAAIPQTSSRLTEITFPATLEQIGASAFSTCDLLTTINFAANAKLTTIGTKAFEYCRMLANVTLPPTLVTMGTNVFYDCRALTALPLPADTTVKLIPGNAFQYSGINNLVIPASVERIDAAFGNCTSLTNITVAANNQLRTLNTSAFAACTGLESLDLSNTQLTNINATTISGTMNNLTTIKLPATVTNIANSGLNCTPQNDSVTITILAVSPPTLGTTTPIPGLAKIAAIKVPSASLSAYQGATGWTTYSSKIEAIPE